MLQRRRVRQAFRAALVESLNRLPTTKFRRLEPRRVLNASFVFDGVDGLVLSNFDNVGGTTQLDVSFDSVADEYIFSLDNGSWIAGGGHVAAAGITLSGGTNNILQVDRSLFLDAPTDVFDLQILDNAVLNDIPLNLLFTGGNIDFPDNATNGSMVADVDGNIDIQTNINTFGSSLTLTAEGNITSLAAAAINTTDTADSGLNSGFVSLTSNQGDIILDGSVQTTGADHSIAAATASNAGAVTITTLNGGISLSVIDASGGNATGGGASFGGNGGVITISAGDVADDQAFDVVLTGDITTAGGNGTTAGVGAAIVITADNDLNINAAIASNGGAIDLNAGNNITSIVGGTITSGLDDGPAGLIDIDAGGAVTLVGSVSSQGTGVVGDGNDITITTVAGSITVADLNASGIGLGAGGSILLEANGTNGDVVLNGAVATNSLGAVTITADDAINMAATSSISASGTGNISLIANDNVSNGNSGDGITMAAGSLIEAGTGSVASGFILLQSIGTNGGPIVAGQLTARSNSIRIDSGNSISLQAAIASGGGLVDLDAVTSISSSAAGSITSTSLQADGTSGAIEIDAGTNLILAGAVSTQGAAADGDANDITITAGGSISVVALNATGTGTGAGGNIVLDANGVNSDVTLNGAVTTNTVGAVTITADDAVAMAAASSINAAGTGNVSITANTDALNGNSGDGITMNGGSSINAGTGTATSGQIVLTSTGSDGGPIAVRALTTRNNTIQINSGDSINLIAAVNSGGGLVDLDAVTTVASTGAGSITTTSLLASGTSGLVDIDAGGAVNLLAAVSTQGAAANGNANNISITAGGSIAVAALNAAGTGTGAGGNIVLDANGVNSDVTLNGAVTTNTVGAVTITADDAVTMAAAGSINAAGTGNVSLTANTDALAGDSGDGITINGGSSINAGTGTASSGQIVLTSTGAAGGPIVAQALTTRNNTIQINSGDSIELQAAVNSGGGLVNLDAVTTVASTGAGSITTTSLLASGTSGLVDIDAGGAVNLLAAVSTQGAAANGNANNISITAGGSIAVAALNAAGTGTGAGGNIVLDANGVNSDVTLNGAVTTNTVGAVTITADDAVTMAAAGSINAAGTGNVSLTANTDALAGDSGDGITMNGGSSINAGTGTASSGQIVLTSTGAAGGPIVAQALTTRNNTIQINSGDSIELQAAVNSGGGLVDLDAVTTVASTAAGSITTTSLLASGTSGLVDIDAGGAVNLLAAVSTQGAAANGNANNISITAGDSIAVAALNATGTGAGAGGNIVLDANGVNSDVTLNGAVTTNTVGAVTITADDAVTMAAAGSISAAGTGNVSITANTDALAGDSGDGITMNGGSSINAGTGTTTSGQIVLTSTGAAGGPIVAQALTTRNNTIQVNSGNSIELQAAVNSGGGLVDLDAVTTVASTAAGSITTTSLLASGTSGIVDIDAGGAVTLSAAVTTAGAAANGAANNISITASGDIIVGALDAAGSGTGASGEIDLAATGISSNISVGDIDAGDVLLTATGNASQTGAITADGLALQIDGTTNLNSLLNNVGRLAADNGGETQFTTTADLTIGPVTVGATTVDNVIVDPGSNIVITAASIVDGDAPDSAAPDIFGNDVTLTATAGSIGVIGDIFQGTINTLEVQADGNLVATASDAIALNPTVAGTTTLNATDVALISAGTLNIDDITVTGDLRIEGADVVANDGTFDLAADRMLFISGVGETLNTTVNVLDVRTGGDLTIASTIDVELLDLDGDNLALATTTASGLIDVTAVGTITVSDDVIAGVDGTTTSTGTVSLAASGATADLIINDVVLTDAGNIVLTADNDIRLGDVDPAESLVTTTTGSISITGDADLDNTGVVLMQEGARVIAGRDVTTDYDPNTAGSASSVFLGGVQTGSLSQVAITASEDVTLGSVQSANNTENAIRITSRLAGIVDSGSTGVDVVANFDGALVTLRSVTGIGSTNAIEMSVAALDVLNSATGAIQVVEIASGGDLDLVNADNAGLIRVQVEGGTLTVVDGAFAPSNGDYQVTSTSGNIALQASDDIVVDSAIASSTGHVSLIAGDDIFVNTTITTGGAGTLYLQADNGTDNDVPVDRVDGINVRAELLTAEGDILLRSLQDIQFVANISSTDGNIGLGAANDILQDADLVTTNGDVLIVAGGNYTMGSTTSVQAIAGDIAADVTGNIALASMSATDVGLVAGGNISDANAGGLNILATNLSLQAGSSIGSADLGSPADQNNNAINTQVSVIEAAASTGIYILEVDDLTIGSVADITVTVTASRDDGLGATTDETLARTLIVLAGLSTVPAPALGGPIKVQVGGQLTVDEAVASGPGDILLRSTVDLIVNATVTSESGNVTLDAGDDLDVNAAVTTGSSGDMVLRAANANAADAIPAHVDGITVGGTLTTAVGRLLVLSSLDLQVDGDIISTSGNIGLVTPGITQLTGTVASTSGGILVTAASVNMLVGSDINTGGDVVAISDGDLLLTSIAGRNVALQSVTGNIVDGNGTDLNITADQLSLRATAGRIGDADGVSPPDTNNNAIDINATTVAAVAADGIYLLEVDGVIVDQVGTVTIGLFEVVRANFNSSTSELGDESQSLADLSNLSSTDGPIKLVATTGNITINDGDADDVGIQVLNAGDILVEARAGSILSNTGLVSGGGHIGVLANVDADLLDDVTTTGTGDIYIRAATGSITIADGIDADTDGVRTNSGSILLEAGVDVSINTSITSATGQIGLNAGSSILQAADVSTTADVLVVAVNLTMNAGTQIIANGNDLVIDVTGSASLGLLTATNVSIEAGLDILNVNGTAGNVIATNLRMVADSDSNNTGTIGTSHLAALPDVNENAIYITVDTLAASSATGIYLFETDDVTIGSVAAVSVTIDDVTRPFFRSDTGTVPALSRSHATLSDLTTTQNGPIKLVSGAGSIFATDGSDGNSISVSAGGSGDVLLDASVDLIIDANVVSGSGNISLSAGGALDINAEVSTTNADIVLSAFDVTIDAQINTAGGDLALIAVQDVLQNDDVTTTGGDVLIDAGRDFVMAPTVLPTTITLSTAGGNVVIEADRDIRLATIDAGAAGNVAMLAGRDIVDNNGDERLNVIADSLSMIATAGSIGADNVLNPDPNANLNAIDTSINRLAALSATGIYIQEESNLEIDVVAPISVTVTTVNFNSSTGSASLLRTELEDLTTTDNGNIKIVTGDGSISVRDGGNNDEIAISADGTGDILLVAGGLTRLIETDSGVVSDSGHITLQAVTTIDIGDDIATGDDAVSGKQGSINILSTAGTVIIADGGDVDPLGLRTESGHILVRAGLGLGTGLDIVSNAEIRSTAGNVGLVADRDILLNDNLFAVNVMIDSGRDFAMAATAAPALVTLTADLVAVEAVGDIRLALIDAGTGSVSLDAGGDILDANADLRLNVIAGSLAMFAVNGTIGTDDPLSVDPSVNVNAIDTSVDLIGAESATGIYVREANGITITTAATVSVQVDVTVPNFNSTTGSASASLDLIERTDLVTTANGSIKLVTEAGDIVADDGNDADTESVVAHGSGDILLAAAQDLLLNATVESDTGNITLQASDDIFVNASVTTAGSGDMVLLASNTNASDAALAGDIDGITVAANLTTDVGQIVVESAGNISIDATVESLSSSIGLIANGTGPGDIFINALVQANSGDVLVTALAGDITMAGVGRIVAGEDVVVFADGDGVADGDVRLTQITAARVGIESLTGDIIDNNGNTINVIATDLILRATQGQIGASGLPGDVATANTNAINIQVDNLAAVASTGIYLQEVNAVTIRDVAAFTVELNDVVRTNFNSTTSAITDYTTIAVTLSDLTATIGPIKLVALAGNVNIVDGDADTLGVSVANAGDILIDARAGAVSSTTGISSGGGHITILAFTNAVLGGPVTTSGSGDVYIDAETGAATTSAVTTGSGDILVLAATNVTLGTTGLTSDSGKIVVRAGGNVQQNANITTTGQVLVLASGNITMGGTIQTAANGSQLILQAGGNILLGQVRATNVSIEANGNINRAAGSAENVIADTARLIADRDSNGSGIIGGVDPIVATAINENALSMTVNTLAARSAEGIYLRDTDAIVIGEVAAVTVSLNADLPGVIETRQVDFRSTTSAAPALSIGHTTLSGLATTHVGNIELDVGGSINVNRDIQAGGATTSITLRADQHILEATTATIVANSLIVDAATFAILPNTNVQNLTARISAASNSVVATDLQNGSANTLGGALTSNPDHLYISRFADGYSLFIHNQDSLNVRFDTSINPVHGMTRAIEVIGNAPNVYIETEAGDLAFENGAESIDVLLRGNAGNPGLVVIAGQNLVIDGASIVSQVVAEVQFLVNDDDLNATIFDGGQPEPQVVDEISSRFLLRNDQVAAENIDSHVLQRVATAFGSNGERGFFSQIQYADDGFGGIAGVETFQFDGEVNVGDQPVVFERSDGSAGERARRDEFLRLNVGILETVVIVRRSSDLFMFSNAATSIQDEAIARDIVNVISLGGIGAAVEPMNVPPVEFPSVIINVDISVPTVVTQLTNPEIELPAPTPKEVSVAIYRVDTDDTDDNRNGQIDADELPSFEEAANDADDKTKIVIEAKKGKTPTPEEIERAKNELLKNPNQPTGAYAIIKEDSAGNQTVLDVFSVRDWPEEISADSQDTIPTDDEIPQLPSYEAAPAEDAAAESTDDQAAAFVLPMDDQALVGGSDRSTVAQGPSRMAAASGFLLGSLWLARHRQSEDGSDDTAGNSAGSSSALPLKDQDFSRSARLRRRLRSQLER